MKKRQAYKRGWFCLTAVLLLFLSVLLGGGHVSYAKSNGEKGLNDVDEDAGDAGKAKKDSQDKKGVSAAAAYGSPYSHHNAQSLVPEGNQYTYVGKAQN